MKFINQILCLLVSIHLTTADCDSNCRDCIDRTECIESKMFDPCAWSDDSLCIPESDTPFIYWPFETDFIDAEDICKETGGHLASIHSLQEQQWASSLCHPGISCYIGGIFRDGPEWEWLDDTPFDFGLYMAGSGYHGVSSPWSGVEPSRCGVDIATAGPQGCILEIRPSAYTNLIATWADESISTSTDQEFICRNCNKGKCKKKKKSSSKSRPFASRLEAFDYLNNLKEEEPENEEYNFGNIEKDGEENTEVVLEPSLTVMILLCVVFGMAVIWVCYRCKNNTQQIKTHFNENEIDI